MRRDMDLYRELLLKLEELPINPGGAILISPDEPDVAPPEVAVSGFSWDQIDYHLEQLAMAGLIVGQRQMSGFEFRQLTPAGHDFLDAVRSQDTWSKTKDVAKKAGAWSL